MKAKSKLGSSMKKKRKSKKSALSRIKSSLIRCIRHSKGLYLRPINKQAKALKKKTETKKHKAATKIIEKIPIKQLSAADFLKYVKQLKILYFRGVFMRDALPNEIHPNKSGIVNLDSIYGDGTHWVCYSKCGKEITYFDSYGNLRPPLELINYFYSSNHLSCCSSVPVIMGQWKIHYGHINS